MIFRLQWTLATVGIILFVVVAVFFAIYHTLHPSAMIALEDFVHQRLFECKPLKQL